MIGAKRGTRRFIKNTGWMAIQQIFLLGIAFVVAPLTARYLKPDNYGLLGYGNSIILFAGAIASLGLNDTLVNEIAEAPEQLDSIIGTSLLLRITSSLLCLLISVVVAYLLEPNNGMLWKITLLQGVTLVFQTYDVIEKWFQYELKMKYIAIANMIARTTITVWKIIILILHASVYWFAFSTSIEIIVVAVLVFAAYKKSNRHRFIYDFHVAKKLLHNSKHYIVASLAITLYMQIDKVMIGKLLSPSETGIYSVATTFATIWQFVPQAIINSARPMIFEKKKNRSDEYIDYYKYLLLAITIICGLVAVFMSIFGRMIILFLYGEMYVEASEPLSILTWSSMVAMLGLARNIWIISEGLNQYSEFFAISAAIINVILNLWGIPRYGINGAAMATLISYLVAVFIAPACIKETRGFVRIYIESFRETASMIHHFRK